MIQHFFPKKKHVCMLALFGGSLAVTPGLHAGELNFSGFMSIGGGFITDEASFEYNGLYEEDIQFNRNLLGIQMTGDISDRLSATVQLTTRTEEDYSIEAEWAYMTYAVTDQSQIRVGRLRTPFYLYSDYLDVGYSYPWVSPPREVYYLPVNNIDGVDFYSTGTLGPLDTSFQAYYGGFDGTYDYIDDDPADPYVLTAQTRAQAGVAVTLGQVWWNVRAAYHQADFTLNAETTPDFQEALGGLTALGYGNLIDDVVIDEDSTTFFELGLTIDTERFVAAIEHIEFETDNAFLPKAVRNYVMLGVRFGDFLLHGTVSNTQDDRKPLETLITDTTPQATQARQILGGLSQALLFEQEVVSFGVRWDFTAGAAFKLQVDQIDRTIPAGTGDDQTAVTFALQSVF